MNISFIGAGNVATNLALGLKNAGHSIIQIHSKTLSNATILASKVNATPVGSLHNITSKTELLLICVPDNYIEQISYSMPQLPFLVAHTSGSVSLNALSKLENYGVIYPLQTFSKEIPIALNQVPFCLEANSTKNLTVLENLAKELSPTIYFLNSDQRKQCHLAAVFANNFTNHFYTIAESILSEKNIPFDILKPLIKETAQKIETISPASAQTGPARRNDTKIMQEHLSHLKSDKLEKIYRFVSESIASYYTSK